MGYILPSFKVGVEVDIPLHLGVQLAHMHGRLLYRGMKDVLYPKLNQQ